MLTEQPLIGHVTDDEEVLEWHYRVFPIPCPIESLTMKFKYFAFFMRHKIGLVNGNEVNAMGMSY